MADTNVADTELDRWAELAARCLRAQAAQVLLVDADEQAFAAVGTHISAPLVSSQGDPLGSLQVWDQVSREWTQADHDILREIAALLSAELEQRLEYAQRRQADERVHQILRMEAIGRLVGHIAHDFNNLLTTIKGNTDLVLLELAPEAPLREDVQEIRRAAERGAELTRRLLAFARSQVLQPEMLDLNALVAGSAPLLRQTLGASIQLMTRLEPEIGTVNADSRQLEQVLIHLAANAREAMPASGRLEIATRDAVLTEDDRRRNPYVTPGPYVLLEIRDTGCGMDPDVQARAFEPFFTTKSNRGAGLGLSMVFGVVKQSGGHVWLRSEPECGTTVSIYLPRVAEAFSVGGSERESPAAMESGGNGETILLVDDEASVRGLVKRILGREGYTVLEASDGEGALHIAAQHPGPIHLLLADLVMPRTGGRELAKRVQPLRSETRVLYMSGFTAEATLRPQVLRAGEAFLSKPFGPDELTRKVREVLAAAHIPKE